ncbi:hypothetical protein QE152_g39840 [Popillia japonica]|uniref:Transposase n=1 Tax=Popillia japonica TaxID=7064 RepID=A0AAW1HTJ0_POPJA
MSQFATVMPGIYEHGKHISTARRYIQENFNISEEDLTCGLTMVQKVLLPQFKTKWSKAYRMKERFLNKNYEWLDGDFIGLRAESKSREANMIQVLLNTSTQQKEAVYNVLFKDDGMDVSLTNSSVVAPGSDRPGLHTFDWQRLCIEFMRMYS